MSQTEVLNFATVGQNVLGDVQLDQLNSLSEIDIPNKLPIIDEQQLREIDSTAVIPLLESLQKLIRGIPRMEMRPIIDISAHDQTSIQNLLQETLTNISNHNQEIFLQNEIGKRESLQSVVDENIHKNLSQVQNLMLPSYPYPSPSPPPPPPPLPLPPSTPIFPPPPSSIQTTSHQPYQYLSYFPPPYVYYPQVINAPTSSISSTTGPGTTHATTTTTTTTTNTAAAATTTSNSLV